MVSKLLEHITERFRQFGFPLRIDDAIIPNDDSTLFVCSGMQKVRDLFSRPNYTKDGSLQSCIRTKDLELVGDGIHLTYFQMLGNFSFGNNDYENSVELWHSIIGDLKIPVTTIHVHPSRLDHRKLWTRRGYSVVNNSNCVWSDGDIGGECCEVFVGELEIGNLVNPMRHSTDVGFGWERIIQIIERKNRIDETSLFDISLSPLVRDHYKTLIVMRSQGIKPGSKGRECICRRLVRRIIGLRLPGLEDWIEQERQLRDSRIDRGRKKYEKFKSKSNEWWYETFGIFREEIEK